MNQTNIYNVVVNITRRAKKVPLINNSRTNIYNVVDNRHVQYRFDLIVEKAMGTIFDLVGSKDT